MDLIYQTMRYLRLLLTTSYHMSSKAGMIVLFTSLFACVVGGLISLDQTQHKFWVSFIVKWIKWSLTVEIIVVLQYWLFLWAIPLHLRGMGSRAMLYDLANFDVESIWYRALRTSAACLSDLSCQIIPALCYIYPKYRYYRSHWISLPEAPSAQIEYRELMRLASVWNIPKPRLLR